MKQKRIDEIWYVILILILPLSCLWKKRFARSAYSSFSFLIWRRHRPPIQSPLLLPPLLLLLFLSALVRRRRPL